MAFAGCAAEILFGAVFGGEFGFAAHFPQQIGIDVITVGFGLLHERCHVAIKFKQHIVGFDFGAFAKLGIDLVGAVVFLNDAGKFELAGFFVKNIHYGAMRKM